MDDAAAAQDMAPAPTAEGPSAEERSETADAVWGCSGGVLRGTGAGAAS